MGSPLQIHLNLCLVKAALDASFEAGHREQASYSDSQLCATVCWRFGSWGLVIKLNYCSDFEHFGQDFKVEVEARFWSWSLVIKLNFCSDFEHFGHDFVILKFKIRRVFEAEVWWVFWWGLVGVTKLNLGQYSEARFGQDFNSSFSQDADVWLRFWS